MIFNNENQILFKSFTKLPGTTPVQFNKKWITIALSNIAPPPEEADDDKNVVAMVAKKKWGKGFIKATYKTQDVKVLKVKGLKGDLNTPFLPFLVVHESGT